MLAETMSHAIYHALVESILNQSEPPGSTLTEAHVAQRFGASRPTAKLALERLVAEGLLQRGPHQAARVPVLSRADITDLFAMRLLLESAATEALASEGAIPSEALAAHRTSLKAAAANQPFAQLDAQFHRALVAAQPSPRLARMHAGLMGEIELCIGQVQAHHLIDLDRLAQQHQRILDAILSGDAEVARYQARLHVEDSRDALLAHVDGQRSNSTKAGT